MKPFIYLETDFHITTSPSPGGQWRTSGTTQAWLVSATGPQTLAYATSREGVGDTLDEAAAEAMRAAIAETAAQILAGPWADTYREVHGASSQAATVDETDIALEVAEIVDQESMLNGERLDTSNFSPELFMKALATRGLRIARS